LRDTLFYRETTNVPRKEDRNHLRARLDHRPAINVLPEVLAKDPITYMGEFLRRKAMATAALGPTLLSNQAFSTRVY
jgi:hypothetical protein